ncbi:uncharacterized protein STEHIDRAFT_95050 [Stereum hirsutum FP-91666 SS1]|uniref:uncharacterized protein n=1 Tax=Stereum hirsutum (strain FP-91666) TaxID=721885 RepID=UPI000440C4A7|nr:uncharacterized protein STEHIDRAFT_95050 [Stereum hirsutum FP-91666 SS1]EIM88109.1 hypothetical protein STEHIDRAFT_95050 [Stereum hirsutum FP-91666 SS1]
MPRKCTVCGSKQWHKEPSSGLVICSEGHILQNYRNETHETQELGPHTLRKRKVRTGRKKGERQSKADPKLYHGARAQYHYFQCLQLLLRKQVAALVKAWDLPPEFEVICRDIWTLYLCLLPSPPPPEPLLYEQDIEGNNHREDSTTRRAHSAETKTSTARDHQDEETKKKPSDESDPESDACSNKASSSDSDSGSDTESNDNDDDDADDKHRKSIMDEEMASLLRGLSDSEPDSDDELEPDPNAHAGQGDNTHEHEQDRSKSKKRQGHRGGRYESPTCTLAVLLVACWTIRVPVTIMDLIRLIDSYTLPYLDPTNHLPPEMTHHLNKHALQAISPPHAPSALLLHGLASRLARRMYATYGVYTPELNAGPLMWRVVCALGGTPVLYTLTKSLAHPLSLPLSLHPPGLTHATRRERAGASDDPGSYKFDGAPPEVALMGVVIVVLKMVYGLDGDGEGEGDARRNQATTATDATDPGYALPRLEDLLSSIAKLDNDHGQSQSEEHLFSARTNVSTAEMGDSELDLYLGFCERALLGEHEHEHEQRAAGEREGSERRILDEYFPLKTGDQDRRVEGDRRRAQGQELVVGRRRAMTMTVEGHEEGEKNEGRKAGEGYTVYNTQDVLGTVPEDYALVVGRAAQWTGVDAEYIYGVVERYERRLVRWWDGMRRRGRVL